VCTYVINTNGDDIMTATITAPAEGDDNRLRAEIAELRLELAALRDQLATEVRTRRIVVVDEQGRERVYSSVGDHYSQIHVAFSENPDQERDLGRSCVTLYAGDESDEDGCASAQVDVVVDGNAVATMYGSVVGSDRLATGEVDVTATFGLGSKRNGDDHLVRVQPTAIRAGRSWSRLDARVGWQYDPI
jgi:uncharacterized protein YrzB (UPF0473 family)